jgi:hypothetical protein
MNSSRALVVYYAGSASTRRIARVIRDELGCGLDCIAATAPRGFFDELLCGLRARLSGTSRPVTWCDPAEFELVILGVPVSGNALPEPVRTYLLANRAHIHRLAVFCTRSGGSFSHVLHEVEDLVGRTPVVSLSLREDEIAHDAFGVKVRTFASFLGAQSPSSGPPREGGFRVAHA